MALTPSDAHELFERACQFPADRAEVVEAVGERGIRSPSGDPVSIETVLDRATTTTFESVTELQNTLMANLDEDHIGRENYDDRSSNPERETDVSF